MRVGEALRHAARRLRAAGVEAADLDAELLLRHVLRQDRSRLLSSLAEPLPPEVQADFLALVEQRAARRPLQHLTGVQAFWRHDFLVTPDVLIPRPETELLLETALDLLRGVAAPVVVDVGTGSGCLAVSLALERADAAVWAVDLSPAALEVARANAVRLGAGERVRLLLSDLLQGLPELAGRVDLVLSNPPYIDPSEVDALQPEVRDHEPRTALVPRGDRYEAYRRLAPQARRALKAGGMLAVEVGLGMAEEVARIVAGAGLREARTAADLRGVPRVVTARAD